MTDKKSLRAQFRKIRSAIPDKKQRDSSICKRILSMERICDADVALVYVSYNSEINTFELISSLLDMKKTVAVPKCEDNGIMRFHIISSLNELSDGMYGIPEPVNNNIITSFTEKTVCIVPGLAFTENGDRLGYGGGYYDRFLSCYPDIFTVALAYEELITDSLPVLPHDLKINAVATNERLVFCNAE